MLKHNLFFLSFFPIRFFIVLFIHFLLLSFFLFSANHQVITRHKSKKMHCLSRQCILNIAAGCHFTDPIALRHNLSTALLFHFFSYIKFSQRITATQYKYFHSHCNRFFRYISYNVLLLNSIFYFYLIHSI